MAESLIGRVLSGRYRITERIGIGGMAEVYQAQDAVLGRMVAIKIMLSQYAADPTFAQRFKQEAAASANLQSPYIVNIYDWGQDNGVYYIVMEYVRGTDLKSGIKDRGAINQRKVAEIGMQVCQALSVAHNQDIIHRDIKSQNIMIQPDGNVKVMDFGIASAKNSVMGKTEAVLGTAHYISPEQAQGKELSAASDIYSLGIVLYEAATGQLPFDGPDAVSVALMQVNDQPKAPRSINPAIDPALEAIIMKAMCKLPQGRFATANDMKRALGDYLANARNGAAQKDGQATAYMGPVGSAGAVAAGAVAAGAVAAGGVMAASADHTSVMPSNMGQLSSNNTKQAQYISAPESGSKKPAGDEKGSKKKTGIIVAAIIAIIAVVVAVIFIVNPFAKTTAVPDVTGKTLENATRTLQEAGFALGTTSTVYDEKTEAGKVVSQDPAAGSKAAAGSKINLTISQGSETVTVPDLTNMTSDQAKTALEKVGLIAQAGEAKYSSDVSANHIISQSPTAGSTINKGASVTYILSLGTENIEVPNVVGKTEEAATRTLQNSGFNVDVETEASSKTKGTVISQSASAGSKLAKGSTVTITVSEGEESSVSVPNVVGYTLDEARTILDEKGLNASVSGSSSGSSKVKSQSPSSGSTVSKGDTITLTTE